MSWEGAEDQFEISVHDEIHELIADHGREVYLRKRTNQKCRCADSITGEAKIDCPTCSGLGYVYLDYKVLAFKYLNTIPPSGAYRKMQATFGVMGTDETIFYIEHLGIYPSIHDCIIEVITDTDGTVSAPPLIERIHSINQIDDLRENHGQVAYWSLRCRRLDTGK